MISKQPEEKSADFKGTLYGIAAYGLWGMFPLYWKLLSTVPSLQILAHRVVWAFVFTTILSCALGKRKDFSVLLKQPKRLIATIASGFLVTANWGIYIWAVNLGRIIESSLGYYLNPLISVALGVLVLREKIDKGILVASGIALAGISILTISYGRVPWIALSLGGTFALYGLIKKVVGLDALSGLAMETAPVFPLALAYLVFEHAAGRGAFFQVSVLDTVLLALSGAVTAIPLFFYAEGVKRIPLSRMGFLQYISPTGQLLIGVLVFKETLDTPRAIAFAFILSALAVYALTRTRIVK
ncbi:MAG: hypothetical protein A2Y38_11160 [Spirochaetes bacterium GWB1_59_5]|nr:MAG: hypothetical protein A2Y38_11160 [Spirochaetes bacterium GWB1_59_5]